MPWSGRKLFSILHHSCVYYIFWSCRITGQSPREHMTFVQRHIDVDAMWRCIDVSAMFYKRYDDVTLTLMWRCLNVMCPLRCYSKWTVLLNTWLEDMNQVFLSVHENTLCYFVLVFFSPFSIAITSLGKERANLSAFRTFVRFVLAWFCRFPFPLGV